MQAAAQYLVHRDAVGRHVADALGVSTVAVGAEFKDLAVDRAAGAHVADEAPALERPGVCVCRAEGIGLHAVEVERNRDRQRIGQVGGEAPPTDGEEDLAHAAPSRPGRSSTVPQWRQVRRARSPYRRSKIGGNWCSMSVSAKNSS